MSPSSSRLLALSIAAILLAACGGGDSTGSSSSTSGTSATTNSTAQNVSVPMVVSDASTEDWAAIGVKILSIKLVSDGGVDQTVYTAPTPAPTVNLVQLDQLGEILGNATIPAGTYTSAVITVSGNASDILLTSATNPEVGFALPGSTTVPSSDIQVQHTQGSGTSLTVPIDIKFAQSLVVSTTSSNALDLEFDLGHPAFIVGHVPVGSGSTLWAVNFDGPVHRRTVGDLRRLVLRHTYGSVASIGSNNASITITKDFPTEPVVSPETEITSSISLQVQADTTNGTIVYDVDAGTKTNVTDFSAESSIVGKYVRVAARYQEDGTLVATRIWSSSTFNSVWVSPEGHVRHVDSTNNIITVENETGFGVPLTVDANTQFFFRQPQSGLADVTPIATGTGFLAAQNLVRGFKVHASVVDPLATPLVAQSIDIETADYRGEISAPTTTVFTYTRKFHDTTDDYVHTMDYISSATANGSDSSGNAITGYKWWNFAYPTMLTDGSGAISGFVAATSASVDFGGSFGVVPSYGASYAIWNDPANPNGWAASASVLLPSTLPLGTVETGFSSGTFTMTETGGSMTGTVAVSTASDSATLVYQVDRTSGIVTVSPIDVTTSPGLASFTSALTAGALVKVYGIPQADSTLQAYVLVYYTGQMPAQ